MVQGKVSLYRWKANAPPESSGRFGKHPLQGQSMFVGSVLGVIDHLNRTSGTTCANSDQMDFLKSAVASAIAKGPAFGYSFGERVDIDQSIWTLQNGTKRVSADHELRTRLELIQDFRTTAPNAAFSPSTLQLTDRIYLSQRTPFASSRLSDILE